MEGPSAPCPRPQLGVAMEVCFCSYSADYDSVDAAPIARGSTSSGVAWDGSGASRGSLAVPTSTRASWTSPDAWPPTVSTTLGP